MSLADLKILIRGAGEMASGVAVRLVRSNFRLVMTELSEPLCVRRTVSFCEALHHGQMRVEDVDAVLAAGSDQVESAWSSGRIAVLVDPRMSCLETLKPDVVVEATLAKKENSGLRPDMAGLVIALGPGFVAGREAHVVIETNRGHNLGRVLNEGSAEPNTGVPGTIGGETARRVLRAPADGRLTTDLDIGAMVEAGQAVAQVEGREVPAELSGVLRGLIRPGTPVHKGLKVGDIDPRGDVTYTRTVSDKARAIGGSVLEAILSHYNK